MSNKNIKYRSVQSVMRAHEAGLVADGLLRSFARELLARDAYIQELQQQIASLAKPKPAPKKKKESTDEG